MSVERQNKPDFMFVRLIAKVVNEVIDAVIVGR